MAEDFDGNFLHNLPKSLVPKQRISLEAISFSLDSIEQKYRRLIKFLSAYPNIKVLMENIQRPERVNIFSDLWSIIDNCHSVLQLIHGFEKKSKNEAKRKLNFTIDARGSKTNTTAKAYYENYNKNIRELRNKMDHLSGNINSLIEKKASQEPLFGSLSYILSNADDCSKHEFDVVLIGSVGFTVDTHSFSALNPADIRRRTIIHPVDHLQFSAFDAIKINVTDLFEDSMELRNVINTDMASAFAINLRRYATEHGLEEKDIFQPLPREFIGGFRVMMASESS